MWSATLLVAPHRLQTHDRLAVPHYDPHMAVLLSPDVPFKGCGLEKGHSTRPAAALPVDAAPFGLLDMCCLEHNSTTGAVTHWRNRHPTGRVLVLEHRTIAADVLVAARRLFDAWSTMSTTSLARSPKRRSDLVTS